MSGVPSRWSTDRAYRSDLPGGRKQRRAVAHRPCHRTDTGAASRHPRTASGARSAPDPDAQFDDELLLSGRAQRLGECEIILYKPRWGAFFGTTLDDHLRENHIDTVVVAGCNYPNCPRTSVYEASERDYRVVLVEDAVSGLYERGRTEMTNIGVTLRQTESVIAVLG